MHYFQDTGLLLLYCMASILYFPADLLFVLAFLCALIVCCACYFLESPRIHLGFGICFLSASLLFPPFFCFFPALFYLFLAERRWLMLSCACLLFLYHMTHSVDSLMLPLWMGIFGFLLAALLQSHTGQYQRLDMLFRQSQDDSRENHLLLTEKNKALLEKQDYEIYTATLRERNRIAREIHDSVGHVLSRSILLLGAARAVNRQTELCPVLDNLDVSLNSAMDSIRSSVHDLHDESVNLEETVRSLTDGFTFCLVLLRYDMGRKVPREVKYCLISILKEALSNVMRHSNASQVCVTMQEHPALYQLCVEDNGTGAAPGDCSKESGRSGIGLTNIQDRVRSLDGTLQISAETGFRIFITIPKKRQGTCERKDVGYADVVEAF